MSLSRNRFLKVATILGALCCTPSLGEAHEKDLRTQTDSWGETEISFCTRLSPDAFGFPGHAFVGFSEKPRGQTRVYRAVGHTVAATAGIAPIVFTYFGGASVAGRQAEERYSHMKQACLTVGVDRAVYQRALSAAKPTLTVLGIPDTVAASLERYSLNENDCIDFTMKVAQQLRSAGLSVPARTATDTPAAYIAKLINANPS
ncbi:hypothetical protein [Bradyrhizobium sp. AUGA SZCCT0283]|uniref:hypothetical protein n=1 Tax=Bradyrhizobium sp. AUGA SZCCT0283 TaxID=2807671 RepID=UPI001BA841EA|nr:hypothetical protein [Bradyrhizobium sp. AUGA SZCCT0283]MBR1276075.1 hypothetical protein [Bradyrhizobium sp. AUGA SZCCT0283]